MRPTCAKMNDVHFLPGVDEVTHLPVADEITKSLDPFYGHSGRPGLPRSSSAKPDQGMVRAHLEPNNISCLHDKFKASPHSHRGHVARESLISADIAGIAFFADNLYVKVTLIFP